MRVIVDTRWLGPHGIGRFARELFSRLPGAEPLSNAPDKLSIVNPLWLWRTLKRSQPDIYFTPGFNPPLGNPCPFVFAIHDLIHLDVPGERDFVKRAYYETVVRPATRRADGVVTISQFSQRRISEWSGLPEERIRVIGVGVSDDFRPAGPKRAHCKPYLLFVGNSKPHKNLKRLLQAFARSGLAGDFDQLLCAPEERTTLEWIGESGLMGAVTVTGPLADAELAAAYRGAAALVFPTLYEGFGLPALEAMACGVPVLTSALTSLPEATADAALVVDPYNVEAISAGMRRLVEDSDLRGELARRGLARARLFVWDDVVTRLRLLFSEVIGGR